MIAAMSLDPHFLLSVLWMGSAAGLTIFLGIPLVLHAPSAKIRTFLNFTSVGVLLFLFIDIMSHAMETIEAAGEARSLNIGPMHDLYLFIVLFCLGFGGALMGLAHFEKHFIKSPDRASGMPPTLLDRKGLATMIALGIGLHNLSEGLVIGQEFSNGAITLSLTLTIGFALHNATEGFAIASPLAGQSFPKKWLLGLGLIGGGPTIIGTFLGTAWVSQELETLFLALAAGAIIYVVGELIGFSRVRGMRSLAMFGLLVGFLVAFGSELLIEQINRAGLVDEAQHHVHHVDAGDFFFNPSTITLKAGQPALLKFKNGGDAVHEAEIVGLGTKVERVLRQGKESTLLVSARRPGIYPLICDRPGHLRAGMRGAIVVTP